MKQLMIAALLLVKLTLTQAQVTDNMKLVDSTTSFSRFSGTISRGSLLKTASFHYYEINDKINQKFAGTQLAIKVYQDGKKYKIKIEGIEKILACNKIQEVIESNIDGDFKGWDGNTSFKLANQQEWKQDNPTGTIFVNLFRPAVLIYLSSEGYKMKIEGVNEDPILVKKTR